MQWKLNYTWSTLCVSPVASGLTCAYVLQKCDAVDIHCCWKLYTLKIIGILVPHLRCASSKLFGTAGEVCRFLPELILSSFPSVWCPALSHHSLQEMKEISNVRLRAYCSRVSPTSRCKVAETLWRMSNFCSYFQLGRVIPDVIVLILLWCIKWFALLRYV